MLKGLFNSESWFWQRMSELADVMLLSLMWLVCCIPVVTIGPSTVALQYVMLKKVRDEADEGIWRLYWRSFRRNLKQGIVVGLIMTVLAVLVYVDVQFYARAEGLLRPLFGSLTVVGGVMLLLISPYVFGLVAWFDNKLSRFFISAFYLALRHLLRTLAMLAIGAAALAAVYMVPLMIVVVPALVALGNASILTKIFDRYTPEPEEPGEESGGEE